MLISPALGPAEQTHRRIGELLERLAHGRQIGDAHGRELHPARQPLEQRKSQVRLERPDLIADRPRREAQLQGGGAEARGASGRLEGAQPGQGRQTDQGPGLVQSDTFQKNVPIEAKILGCAAHEGQFIVALSGPERVFDENTRTRRRHRRRDDGRKSALPSRSRGLHRHRPDRKERAHLGLDMARRRPVPEHHRQLQPRQDPRL